MKLVCRSVMLHVPTSCFRKECRPGDTGDELLQKAAVLGCAPNGEGLMNFNPEGNLASK